MSRVLLIDFTNIYSFSVRSISSYVKGKGFEARTIHYHSGKKDDFFSELSEKSLNAIYEHSKDCAVVGISLLSTHYLKRAIQINNFLKSKIKSPIVWGGVPVICDPAFYLCHADLVCTGEGEIPIVDLLSGKKAEEVRGLLHKNKSGRLIKNDIPDLLDLNDTPIPYFDFDNTFVMKADAISSLKDDPTPLYLQSKKGYRIFPIRGCPYSCAFCSNNQIKKAFKNKGPVLRSTRPDRIIFELKKAKEIIPGLRSIMFYEDDFMVRREEELKELLDRYTGEIILSFNVNATIQNITEKKVDMILDAGLELEFVKIGLQAANRRVNRDVFKRFFDKDIYLNKLTMLASKGVPVVLDVISDNPYETIEDKYESALFYSDLLKRINSISTIKTPVKIMDHKLMYYPGTSLYDRALKDGIIKENYIKDTLLCRRTNRNRLEDMDNDAFILALFDACIRKKMGMFFNILRNKKAFFILSKSGIFKATMFLALISRNLLKRVFNLVRIVRLGLRKV
jgi:radical SAM superfamily enzyme YgiQ (UPF0313 family)